MGWKGAVRSIGAAVRAAERDAKRRQRELEKQQKHYEKMQELERAAYEVEIFENHIEIIKSLHKECSKQIDWKKISLSRQPVKPTFSKLNEEKAKLKVSTYRPGFFDKVLKQTEKKKENLEKEVRSSVYKDKREYKESTSEWTRKISSWKENVRLSKKILSGDTDAKLKVINDSNPFSEISNLGSKVFINIDENDIFLATIHVHGEDIVPSESKSLLKSGKLSVKKMPKGTFNEIYQDYVCSCLLRVAREIFAIVPDEFVIVTAIDKILNLQTGHLEELPVLSACIPRKTLDSLNMNAIDPSDSMANFIHNMSFKKTKGFSSVSTLDASCLPAGQDRSSPQAKSSPAKQQASKVVINSGELITEIAGGANLVEGKQTWEHAEEKKHDIECMKKCCDAELRTMKKTDLVPAPYYFERVAILSRKERNYQQETDYCELYINTVENFYKKRGTKGVADVRNGPTYKAIVKRLPRAKELQDNHSSQAKPEPARSQPKPRLEKPQEQAKKNWPAIGKKRIEAKQYK